MHETEGFLDVKYAEAIREISDNLQKSKELYESLPKCIKDEIRKLHGYGETLPYCLNKGVRAINDVKKDFGMKE